ncbi:hypothetical protein ACSSS7_005268 [Eimeria intestinalis]
MNKAQGNFSHHHEHKRSRGGGGSPASPGQHPRTGCKHVSMLPACTTTVEASSGVDASDFTRGVKSLTSSPSSRGASPAPCLLTLRPSPVVRSLAEKLDNPTATGSAEPSLAGASARPLRAEGADASDASEAPAFSSNSATEVEAGRVKRSSSPKTSALVESLSHADDAAYEEVRLQELEFDALDQHFVYPCPCGDLFELPLADLRAAAASAETQGFALASCPSCSLKIKACVEDRAGGGGEAARAGDRAADAAVTADNQHSADTEDSFSAVECTTTTFWSAFNTPLRKDVFGSCAATEAAASTSAIEYRDAVEEAVRSLRRFRVEQGKTLSDGTATGGRTMMLHDGRVVHVLDIAQDAGARAPRDASNGQRGSGEFEYDLYAIESDSEDACSPVPPFAAREAHKQRLLELLQQDRSAVALVEVEEVDKDTGLVTRGCGGMQLFLEEFGDIDDSESDEGGEIDYPSGGSSHDEREAREFARRRWDRESSDATSSESNLSDKDDFFDDDYL